MMLFTVEATTKPTDEAGLAQLEGRYLDIVPGTLLIGDPPAPRLLFPVTASTAMRAARFIEGVARISELEIVAMSVYPTPETEIDFELDQEDAEAEADTEVVEAVHEWMLRDAAPPARLDRNGHLICTG